MPFVPTTKGRALRKVNAMAQAHLVRLLLEGQLSCEALAAETGLHYVTVLHYTRELRLAGAAYIDHYEQNARGVDCIKVYKLGLGMPDAKPFCLSDKEKSRRYREGKRNKAQQRLITFQEPIQCTKPIAPSSSIADAGAPVNSSPS